MTYREFREQRSHLMARHDRLQHLLKDVTDPRYTPMSPRFTHTIKDQLTTLDRQLEQLIYDFTHQSH